MRVRGLSAVPLRHSQPACLETAYEFAHPDGFGPARYELAPEPRGHVVVVTVEAARWDSRRRSESVQFL